MHPVLTAVSFIVSYLIGSISFSYLITKKIKKIDIRKTGSGNAGATNTLRVLGVGPAIGVLVLDVLKGVAAVLIARSFGLADWAVALSGLLAIVGHDFPVYFGFKGGKGVATTIGVFFMMMPLEALIAGILAIVIIAISRFVSVGSLFFLLVTPVLGYILAGYSPAVLVAVFLITLLGYYQHRENIIRLLHGKENKIGGKKSQA
ncbi:MULTISPECIES: glycerol-3-phosphate 1-O-acyltransferase PlsY [unclassified Sporolactobacillus]|uniref:glycerol-3-phosphate 1-O-acyltransferase PlsY n=1 Tax=unclassified Sporolactobacillus TaxID=2628533 RepID=UPI0023684CA4|nr:glycerol-3-phosphate 1-O-acyltransferase PlsY [Sporolactobacillus sp. CQH2019]MDD9148648.1 glycerol-3-phosphate 1-O-acyltransferase PlsY [Sporolactobacillus sp. CQH2019]